MTISEQERAARSRLLVLSLIRLGGILVMAAGLAVASSDLVREGGWPAVGVPLALAGFVESILLPKFVARRWRNATER